VDADTGERVGVFPAPTWTLTIGRHKPFVLVGGAPVSLVPIGLDAGAAWACAHDPGSPAGQPPEAWIPDEVTRFAGFPPVASRANKWDRGHVAVLAGSPEKAGAGVLAAIGALRGGAGLVTLCTPRACWTRLGALPPEVMLAEPGEHTLGDVVVAGPGLGRGLDAELRRAWAEDPRPWIFDADALRALDGSPSPHPRLLTPHAGEAAALLGQPWRALERDRLATARALRAIAPAVYKGAWPLVTGEAIQAVPGELPQLGAGGSGDVFAGLCGALLARAGRTGPLSRERVEGVALAAVALQLDAARRAGPPGITPSEIAAALPAAAAALDRSRPPPPLDR
jgi:hydroxyethylthiazole kinase-like uncharacterized protein yjeF